MRYVIVYGAIFLPILAMVVWLGSVWHKRTKPGVGRFADNNLKAIGTGSDAVRCLDQLLTDPTLIASIEWNEKAKSVVNEWYGKGR